MDNKANNKNIMIIVISIVVGLVLVACIAAGVVLLIFKSGYDMYDNTKKDIKDIYESGEKIINDQTKNKESEMFNDDLDITEVSYDGEELKIIISNVILSNSVNKDHIVKVNYNGSTYSTTQQLNELIIKIEDNKKYTVTKESDSNGFINTINIM